MQRTGTGGADDTQSAQKHGYNSDGRHRHEYVPREDSDGHRGKALAGRPRRGEDSRAGRNELPAQVLGAYAADGFLAHRTRNRRKAGSERYEDAGRRGQDVTAERGETLPALRGECRTADRPRLGMGAMHDKGHKGLQAIQPQPFHRTGTLGGIRFRQGKGGDSGNGGQPLTRTCGKEDGMRPDGHKHRI